MKYLFVSPMVGAFHMITILWAWLWANDNDLTLVTRGRTCKPDGRCRNRNYFLTIYLAHRSLIFLCIPVSNTSIFDSACHHYFYAALILPYLWSILYHFRHQSRSHFESTIFNLYCNDIPRTLLTDLVTYIRSITIYSSNSHAYFFM